MHAGMHVTHVHTYVYSLFILFILFIDGTERPVAFASRTLSTAEKRCAQLERKLLHWYTE
jgi:hypothetical protein